MDFLTAVCTDVGIYKNTNQDSLCLKQARTPEGTVIMAAICDGMGGLSKGEVASATVVKAFSSWFDNELPAMMNTPSAEEIRFRWDEMITELNLQIGNYGRSHNTSLGTTLTVLLIVDSFFTIIGHVGDSRVYKLNQKLEILTEDQTVVGLEVKRGQMTWEEAENDSRKNVLLQCIGASKTVIPEFVVDVVEENCIYMICSDGFRHTITANEIFDNFKPQILTDEVIMRDKAVELVELNKARNERDNISVLLIKTITGG